MSDCKGSPSTITDIHAMHKELDEASCPICMDHPHNAVLLMCSSHDKGCRSYICDTSYRHSNCLDRYKTLRVDHEKSPLPHSTSAPRDIDSSRAGQFPYDTRIRESHLGLTVRDETADAQVSVHVNQGSENIGDHDGILERRQFDFQETNTMEESRTGNSSSQDPNLKCPLCRGNVYGWKIMKEARQYLDLKHRCCSQESCSFSGNYRELRRHARRVHPTRRPADTDPSRERAWRRLEHQREYGDIVSAIRSAMPGAVVVGDYVIDNGDAQAGDSESNEFGEGRGPWWTTFFLFQMLSSGSSNPRRPTSHSRGGLSRVLARSHRPSIPIPSRRYLWGENLLGLQDEVNWRPGNRSSEDINPRPRRRRRFTRSRPGEN